MTGKQLKEEILSKKSLLKKGRNWIADKYGISTDVVNKVLNELKDEAKAYRIGIPKKEKISEFIKEIKKRNPNVDFSHPAEDVIKKVNYKPNKKLDPNNVLIVGDLHAPFTLDGYLEFNLDLQKKYNAGTVVFIGDVVDGCAWNFHSHNVDGMSVKDELIAAIKTLEQWYKAFPTATLTLGNHDLLISRKAREFGLSQLFIRYFGDIIKAPKTWNFVDSIKIDDVLYMHGSIGNAIKRAKEIRHSLVMGHLHTEAFVQWSVSEIDAIFGLQVGCGIDRHKYAFEYAQPMPKKPIISSGLVLDKGKLPLIELMKL